MEHGPVFYLAPWSAALVLAVAALSLVTRIPSLQLAIDRGESGRTESRPRFYRLGGALLASLFLVLLFIDQRLEWNPPFIALFLGSLAIIIFSLADDFGHVGWPWHLAFQILLGVLVFSSEMRLHVSAYLDRGSGDMLTFIGLVGVVGWVVLIMNAINWADGTDGLMPGISVLSFGTLFLLALRPEVNQPTIAILAVMLAGLSLGLLFFNWHPSKIIAGTGGAYFFGFALSVLGLYAGMKVATLLLVLAVPVCDALFVFFRRIVRGQSPFLPDQEHLHHLLLARGWRPSSVASAYLVVTGLMGLLALSFEGGDKVWIFLIAGGILTVLSVLLHASLRKEQPKEGSVC